MGFFRKRRTVQDDLLTFSREMSSLLALRAPVDHCLASVSKELGPGPVKRAVESAASQLVKGIALSQILSEHPTLFPTSYVRCVAVGEDSGDLASSFSFLAKQIESRITLEKKLRGLLIYPFTVVAIAALVLWLLLVQIVPVFEGIVQVVEEGKGEKAVPLSMRFLIATSHLLTLVPNWFSFAAAAALIVGLGWMLLGRGPRSPGRVFAGFPYLRRVRDDMSLAILTGVLGTSLRSGVPLHKALYLARDTLDDSGMREALAAVARGVQSGGKVGRLLEETGKFPPTFTWLVSTSEEEGTVSAEMATLSERYFQQALDSLSQLESVTKPVLIIFLSVIVGGVVLTMFSALIGMPGMIPLGRL